MSEKTIVMTEIELEEMITKVVKRANENLYKGLSQRFLHQIDDNIRAVLQELEDMQR